MHEWHACRRCRVGSSVCPGFKRRLGSGVNFIGDILFFMLLFRAFRNISLVFPAAGTDLCIYSANSSHVLRNTTLLLSIGCSLQMFVSCTCLLTSTSPFKYKVRWYLFHKIQRFFCLSPINPEENNNHPAQDARICSSTPWIWGLAKLIQLRNSWSVTTTTSSTITMIAACRKCTTPWSLHIMIRLICC